MQLYTNPFSLNTVKLDAQRIVDRARHVQFLNQHVIDNGENVLVTGPFGIGKTCLLRKFRAGLPPDLIKRTLIIEMNTRQVSADASEFLSDVFLALVRQFWIRVLKLPHSELVKSSANPGKFNERLMPEVKGILDLFRLVNTKSVVSELRNKSTFGLDKIVKANSESDASQTIERGDLTPADFIGLAEEILSQLKERGIERTLIFGDEANHIDPDIEATLIRRNFEVFASSNVQFVLTSQAEVLAKVPQLRDAFPTRLDVEPFEDRKLLDELLAVYSLDGNVPNFSNRSRDLIWRISRGIPSEIQRLCIASVDIAIERAVGGNEGEIDADVLMEAVARNYTLQTR